MITKFKEFNEDEGFKGTPSEREWNVEHLEWGEKSTQIDEPWNDFKTPSQVSRTHFH